MALKTTVPASMLGMQVATVAALVVVEVVAEVTGDEVVGGEECGDGETPQALPRSSNTKHTVSRSHLPRGNVCTAQ